MTKVVILNTKFGDQYSLVLTEGKHIWPDPVVVPAFKFWGARIFFWGECKKCTWKCSKICHFYAKIVKFLLILTHLKSFWEQKEGGQGNNLERKCPPPRGTAIGQIWETIVGWMTSTIHRISQLPNPNTQKSYKNYLQSMHHVGCAIALPYL